ncbi:hypothetical protein ACFPYJ_08900 [Paenibacillus solisilvae]|uniref:Uncharacterized protein n=1 Tax=Paenibacillus solisilvae TaxID=2486751 RepID=A0ABW0VWL2_9BACL
MAVYNKLVRDLIPAIIQHQGHSYRSRILDPSEYKEALEKKLQEEIEVD